jgi:PDZ domain-containing protein
VKPSRVRRGLGFVALVVFISGFFGLALLPTPYLIERPGPAYNVLGEVDGEPVIKITNAESFDSISSIDILTVSVVGNPDNTPSWIEIAMAWFDSSQKVVPVEYLYPKNRTTEDVRAESSAMMEISQQDAIAAALEYLEYEVPRKIYVSEVAAEAAASGKLVAADFVLQVNGQDLLDIEQLRTIVNAWNEEDPLQVKVDRNGTILTKEISPIKDSEGNYRLGVLVGYKYDFPIGVELQLGEVGGPSGGTMFALGVIDRLTEGELTGGVHVAGTGTISQSGQVGPIGGIVQKLYGAERAGAKVFFAPETNCPEVVGKEPAGLKVVKIATLQDALDALEVISSGGNLESLPSCTK